MMTERNRVAAKIPLVVRVKIDSDDVEAVWVTTELRRQSPAQHVVHLELRQAIGFAPRLRIPGTHHVDQRLGYEKPRSVVDVTNRLNCCDVRAHELALELATASRGCRLHTFGISTRPS